MPRDVDRYLPLTPVVFEILVALADEERHGYAIMQEVEERTEGRMALRPGTLYRAIDRLLEQELIEESATRPDPKWDDERRRYYRLTRFGRQVVTGEAERLASAVSSARAKRILGRRP